MTRLNAFCRQFALTCGSLLLSAGIAAAQPAVATLGGRVTDPQSAAAPGATVTARRAETAATWTSVSDADGRFSIPMLPPGTYHVEVQLAGFSPWRVDAITLRVGQDQQLEVQLRLGQVQEAVSVVETARVVTTAVDGVLDASEIETLPLNGRNFLELALLVPGNSPTPTFDPTKTNSVLISSAGQLGRGGNITIDGQDNNDDVVGGPLMNLPIDAVQEFQIATNRFGADIGRSASSAINVITRSGSNTNHGSAAAFFRDDAWQAVPSTLDDDSDTPPFGRQHVSGSIGGPLRRDRLFWFGAGEFRHQDGGILVGTRNVAQQTIPRSFAEAPLRDTLWSLRLDTGGTGNRFTVRYAGEWANDTASSAGERALGSATQRQEGLNRYNSVLGTWTSMPSSTFVNALSVSVSTFLNDTEPVATAPQLTFPSLVDGASFRMPQETLQTRLQIANSATLVRGAHSVRVGGEFHRVDAEFRLGVFQQGRVELVQDFPSFDHTGDGRIDDNDLLFAVTLRSGKPDQALILPDSDNTHVAGFVQDDWNVSSRLQINAGLRYEFDTDVNNQSRVDQLNPIVLPFVTDERTRDKNNFAPRVGFAWNVSDGGLLIRGGYGIYYDRIVLQIQSLERGLDGRALPIEVRAGNVFFLDPNTGRLPPFAPTLANPFTGFILPGAGASGINIIDPHLQNPTVHEFHLGFEQRVLGARARVDVLHDQGVHFLIGRTVGEVFNPVVGGPDRVVNIESSARTKYDALMLSVDRPFAGGRQFRASYTLAKAFNYANDDQIPFLNGPIDPNDLGREFGPTPNDRRHRFVASGLTRLPGAIDLSALLTISSGVPMDIMMPSGQTRIPVIQRNAGGRQFKTAAELNTFISDLNAGGGIDGVPLPLVSEDARFNDAFSSLDLRVSRPFTLGARVRVEPMIEVFNLFNTTNILGTTNVNYSGFSNVLVRDSEQPGTPGFLRSSSFGQPVTTAGGVFGSGGPRAMQLAARLTF
ncbi:MAG TPA: TonB-dependent receptor [Vicinamibacterales bacterium]|nr:TonB-dependent receptor [Vicinamibacterales bacterium]